MKYLIFPIIIVFQMVSCTNKSSNPYGISDYTPSFDTLWTTVDKQIKQNWHLSVTTIDPLPLSFTESFTGSKKISYWETYFINEGLIVHEKFDVARNNIENLVYLLNEHGFVPASNYSEGMNFSNLPFLSMMVKDLYLSEDNPDKEWLSEMYNALVKEYKFWTDTSSVEDHQTTISGLQRYSHLASMQQMINYYRNEIVPRFSYPEDAPLMMQLKIAGNLMTEAESGMDFTPRFENRCPSFIPVDLNTNLYVYEMNFAWMKQILNMTDEYDWGKKAGARKELINKYCWDEEKGLYMDYDFENGKHSKVASASCFWPVWAGIADEDKTNSIINNLGLFEYDFGITSCEKGDRRQIYQWDYPSAMPPFQFIVVYALKNSGHVKDAKRIAAKYLDLVSKNFIYPIPETCGSLKRAPGQLWGKYNVEGIISDAEFCAGEQNGWSAGIYACLYNFVTSYNETNETSK